MPNDRYIPRRSENPTTFPVALEADLEFAARKSIEMWARFYPTVRYKRIKLAATPVSTPKGLSGVGTGGTVVDDLYGESVPDHGDSSWRQPHSTVESAAADAHDHHQYEAAQDVHCYLRVDVADYELKRYGIEEQFNLLGIFAAAELDERKIIVSQGDRFLWQGQEYQIHERKLSGWFFNTDIPLYVVTTCDRVRRGS